MGHRVFLSYHHSEDQARADLLREYYGQSDLFVDRSLQEPIRNAGTDEILATIRTQHLRDSTVTAVLIGRHTAKRKWVDWEIYSSLRPYGGRTINGLLGIVLPTAGEWPARFTDNYQERTASNGKRQVGYAKVVHWDEIVPEWLERSVPSVFEGTLKKRRTYLRRWIQSSFDNRSRSELIDNSRTRLGRNKTAKRNWLEKFLS